MHVPQTRIQPLGRYVPNQPARPAAQRYFTQPPVDISLSPQARGFFEDVWAGAKDQLKDHGNRLLHPIDTVNRALDTTPRQLVQRTLAPYQRAFRSGHPGRALGRLLANVVVIGGAILGGRALFANGLPRIGGGASVGMRGPVGALIDRVGGFFGGATKAVSGLFGRVTGAIGNGLRWLIGGGGGAGIGLG